MNLFISSFLYRMTYIGRAHSKVHRTDYFEQGGRKMDTRDGSHPETYLNYATFNGDYPAIKMFPDTGFIYVRLISVIFALAGWHKRTLNFDYFTEEA